MKILTAEEIRQVDRLSTERFHIPGVLLMENAGMRVVEVLEARFDELDSLRVAVLSGKGNNGGDGFVVARQLMQRGCAPRVYLFADPSSVSGDARINLEILTAIGCPLVTISNREDWERERPIGVDILVDALFGTGLSKPLGGHLGAVVASLRSDFPDSTILSVDVPSGCRADEGVLDGPAVEADLTVTLSAPKPCLVLPPACLNAGEVVVADIGNPVELVEADEHAVELLLGDSFPAAAGERNPDSHKGDYGKILVIGGSTGKSGAAAMAAEAALRAGAGLVTAAVPQSVLPLVAGHMAEVMTEPLGETSSGSISTAALEDGRLEEVMAGKSVLALGPGIGREADTMEAVRRIVGEIASPLVLDADGLYAFAGRAAEIKAGDCPIVITPHSGEMARLIGCEIGEVEDRRPSVARQFARSHGVYVVLKGFRTVVACPDGRIFINSTGNAGMATAGSGDVLTGMIAGILGQPHLGTFEERLCLAVYLHGLAGDLAAGELGEESMTARDLIDTLPEAWARLRAE